MLQSGQKPGRGRKDTWWLVPYLHQLILVSWHCCGLQPLLTACDYKVSTVWNYCRSLQTFYLCLCTFPQAPTTTRGVRHWRSCSCKSVSSRQPNRTLFSSWRVISIMLMQGVFLHKHTNFPICGNTLDIVYITQRRADKAPSPPPSWRFWSHHCYANANIQAIGKSYQTSWWKKYRFGQREVQEC